MKSSISIWKDANKEKQSVSNDMALVLKTVELYLSFLMIHHSCVQYFALLFQFVVLLVWLVSDNSE